VVEALRAKRPRLPGGDPLTPRRFQTLGMAFGMSDGFVLHEPIYCQGRSASRWAAERVRTEFPEFDAEGPVVRFTGEMVYPWMLEEQAALRPFREAAELLAEREEWPALYDRERLGTNEVPCAAVVYHDDMYVDAGLSLETARGIRGLRTWVTNELEHDGVRREGEAVLSRLIDLTRGER
jgi:hypothetical protein